MQEMATKLTSKQAKFAKEYLETGNATEAAVRAYKPKNRATARSIGSENLTKPNITGYLNKESSGAAARVVRLSKTAKNETVRLNANKDILDRAGHFVDKARHPEQPNEYTFRWMNEPEPKGKGLV